MSRLIIYKLCKFNRPKSTVYNYALVSNDFKSNFVTLIDCNAMSVVKGAFDGYENWIKAGEIAQSMVSREIRVEAKTLTSILDEYFLVNKSTSIDLLVLDVEGYEIEVLKGFDFIKYSPKYLLIEMHSEERKVEIENIILPYNYKLVSHIVDSDYLYRVE